MYGAWNGSNHGFGKKKILITPSLFLYSFWSILFSLREQFERLSAELMHLSALQSINKQPQQERNCDLIAWDRRHSKWIRQVWLKSIFEMCMYLKPYLFIHHNKCSHSGCFSNIIKARFGIFLSAHTRLIRQIKARADTLAQWGCLRGTKISFRDNKNWLEFQSFTDKMRS